MTRAAIRLRMGAAMIATLGLWHMLDRVIAGAMQCHAAGSCPW